MVDPAFAQTVFSIVYVGLLLGVAGALVAQARDKSLSSTRQALYFWLLFDSFIHVFCALMMCC